MSAAITNIQQASKSVFQFISKGPWPYVLSGAYTLLGFLWVFSDPQSLVAFLVFLSSAFSLFFLKVKPGWKIGLALVMALILAPLIGVKNIFYMEVIFQIGVYSALALGLNIIVGFAGLLNLGYVAFYAVGAYLWAIFGSRQLYLLHEIPGTQPINTPFFLPASTWYLFILGGVILAALVGILLGSPVLRLRGDYLAIVTLGFGEIVQKLANNLDKPLNLTNGPQGITPIQRPPLSEPLLDVLRSILLPIVGKNVSTNEFYNIFFYLAALIIALSVVLVVTRLNNSKIGRAWTAIREDEMAAMAMGVPVVRMKLAAFSVGASFAGAVGVLMAASRTFISPESFSFMQSIGVLTMVILGGIGSIPGVIIGAAAVVVLNLQILQGLSLYLAELRQSDSVIPVINFAWKNLSTQLDPAKYQRMLFGLILILMMIYRPAGLVPELRRKMELKKKNDIPIPVELGTGDANAEEGGSHASA